MSPPSIEDMSRLAESWHQILDIKEDGNDIVVTVSNALIKEQTAWKILSDAIRFPLTHEIIEFFQRPEIQAKIFSPSKRGIVLIDIADYSKFDTRGQGAMLAAFHEGLKSGTFSSDLFSDGDKNIDLIVPTGDGCFVILKEGLDEQILQFICSIHAGFYCHQKRILKLAGKDGEVVGLRFAGHVGEVSFITDSAGNRNAYGTGLNEAARILDLGRKLSMASSKGTDSTGIVYFCDSVDAQAVFLNDYLSKLDNVNPPLLTDLGVGNDKHDFEYHLRSFGPLLNQVGFTFGKPLPQLRNPSPIFLKY